jgi:glycosyltransferase involved in cell wall biosynthesis
LKKFTLVIPTRNRLEYLKVVLNHIFTDPSYNFFETDIIVAENNCNDGTKEFLKNFSNIKILSSDKDLSMTENWSRIIPVIKSEWVIFIGDDDCLVPNFFTLAKKWIDSHPNIEIINWVPSNYRWPSAPDESNTFRITLFERSQIYECNEYISKCFSSLQGIMAPPSLYHSLCKTSLIDKCIQKYGEFNLGFVPDFGSGILFMSVANNYLRLPSPLSIMGFGSKSTGASFKASKNFTGARDEFIRLTKYTSDEVLLSYPPNLDITFADVFHLKMMGAWRVYFLKHGVTLPEITNEAIIKYLLSRIPMINIDTRERFVDELITYTSTILLNFNIDKSLIFKNQTKNIFKPGINVNKGSVSMAMILPINIINDASKAAYLTELLSFRSPNLQTV